MKQKNRHTFFLGIILPTILAIIISIVSIYTIILPTFKDTFLNNKKEMIRELTNVAWNILELYEKEQRAGYLDRDQAQRKAIEEIRHLRYGDDNKDYFWITDMHPRMIMHPYSPELDGQDLTSNLDADGAPIFLKMKEIAEHNSSGYLDYTWHSKYDSRLPVAKLSYVRQFGPWQWIVGTGVFLDDVEQKIAHISQQMLRMIFATVILFSLLLLYVARQSFTIEKKRHEAEKKLSLSRQKYKALAESATDPMVMMHDNTIIYANKSMCSLLGYLLEELKALSFEKLFQKNDGTSKLHSSILEGYIPQEKVTELLLAKDGTPVKVELSFYAMNLGDQTATVMAAKDIRATDSAGEADNTAKNVYQSLLDQLAIGTFRLANEKNLPLLQASTITREYLEIDDEKELSIKNLLDVFIDIHEKEELIRKLSQSDTVKNMIVHLARSTKSKQRIFSLSLAGSGDTPNSPAYYDGFISDITEQKEDDQQRENLIVELQTSLLFLNQPIKFSLKDFVSCNLNTTIGEATRIMAKARLSSILVTSEAGEMIGIITDMVLRERVIAAHLPYETPVYQVMSSPLIYIDDSALIFEAVLLMQEKSIKHLVVKNSSGDVVSVISNEELLHVHRYSTAFMLSQIHEADSIDTIISTNIRVPRIIKSLADSGAHAKNITRVITKISDTVLEKIMELGIDELGEPPKPFAFISLGSEGRGEQTLVTDQDNAIIYEDVAEDEDEAVQLYFEELGKKVCTWLDMAGYDFCKGEIMAMNPKWCQPITVWKSYFTKWIQDGTPKDLLEVSIFFDFRCLYGNSRFTNELRQHIAGLVGSRTVFLKHLANSSLSFRPPLDFFGNIQADGSDSHANSFDIKKAITCIVGFARVYAVERTMEVTNTIERIEELAKSGKINAATHTEIVEAYNYLMQLRFRHQVRMVDEGKQPDNYIHMGDLSHMDKVMLKKTLSQVASIQQHLSYDFSTST